MDLSSVYVQLPHDISGSRAKNRFRAELNWGISKMLDIMETSNKNFSIVFDYVCDIEIHFDDTLEFYQIKTKKGVGYNVGQLTKVEKGAEGSILGKIYVVKSKASDVVSKVAVVSNVPLRTTVSYDDPGEISLSVLDEKSRNKIVNCLKNELKIETVDLDAVYYIFTRMDLQSPDDAIRGKLVSCFERIMKCEPSNPNALFRLVKDTVSIRACAEFVDGEQTSVIDKKGLRRREIEAMLQRHARMSKNGIEATEKYINGLSNVTQARNLRRCLCVIIGLLESDDTVKKLEAKIVEFLKEDNDVGTIEEAILLIKDRFMKDLPVEYGDGEKTVLAVVFLNRYKEGYYDHANDIF